jgi:ABC-type amino acid transport system permease subunit
VLGSDLENLSYWVSLYLLLGILYFVVAFGVSQIAKRSERAHQYSDLVYSLTKF